MNIKKLTSFTMLTTGEGTRIAYTYSEISENGTLVSQNNRGNFIVMNPDVSDSLKFVENYIIAQFLS